MVNKYTEYGYKKYKKIRYKINKLATKRRSRHIELKDLIMDLKDMGIKEGDVISIDIPKRTLKLEVPENIIKTRLTKWRPPEPKIKTGYLARYSKLVTSANTGAILT